MKEHGVTFGSACSQQTSDVLSLEQTADGLVNFDKSSKLASVLRAPYMTYLLFGWTGVLLMPLSFVVLLVSVLCKMLLLNPPGSHWLQGHVQFEAKLPFRIETTDFTAGMRAAYSAKWQRSRRGGVKTRVIWTEGVWWENLSLLGRLHLPLMATAVGPAKAPHEFVQVSLPYITPHVLIGHVRMFRDPATKQLLVTGRLKCWFVLRPVYRVLVSMIFESYIKQLTALKEEDRILKDSDLVEYLDNSAAGIAGLAPIGTV